VQRTAQISNRPDYTAEARTLIVANFAADKIAGRRRERRTFVCQMDGRIVGTIALGGDRLRTLFVEPELQGSGVGARLVAHLEAHARQAGVTELKLSASLTARGFYERLGYRTIEREEHGGISTYLMTKPL
jgi:N-acetylglutamate synthase-like GNAT family acetyltransferase